MRPWPATAHTARNATAAGSRCSCAAEEIEEAFGVALIGHDLDGELVRTAAPGLRSEQRRHENRRMATVAKAEVIVEVESHRRGDRRTMRRRVRRFRSGRVLCAPASHFWLCARHDPSCSPSTSPCRRLSRHQPRDAVHRQPRTCRKGSLHVGAVLHSTYPRCPYSHGAPSRGSLAPAAWPLNRGYTPVAALRRRGLCDYFPIMHAVANWLGTAHFVARRPGGCPLGTHCATACTTRAPWHRRALVGARRSSAAAWPLSVEDVFWTIDPCRACRRRRRRAAP